MKGKIGSSKSIEEIRYYIIIYLKIIIQSVKSRMQFRTDFFVSLIGIILVNVLGYLSFWVIFTRVDNIGDWNYYEIQFLYGFFLVSISPAQLFLDNLWNLSRHVNDGKFIMYCFRPVNLLFYYVSETINVKAIGQLLVGIMILSISWTELELTFNVLMLLKLLMVLLNASLIMGGIIVLASATSFWIIDARYVMSLFDKLKDYSKYPLTVFSGFVKLIFTFIIPIGYIGFYPCLFLLNKTKVTEVAYLSFFFGFIFFYFAYKLWMYGALRYDGTGS